MAYDKDLIKTPEEYLLRNINVLIENGKRDTPFGVTYVQRVCRVGYNQARSTIEHGIKQGYLMRDIDREWLVRFKQTQPNLCIPTEDRGNE